MHEVKASMAGSIWKINIAVGDSVSAGDEVVILESMKMEIPIAAEQSGTVQNINLNEGDFVNEGDVILEISID